MEPQVKNFAASYPEQWTPEMLYRAALTTLDVFEKSLKQGYGLKEASAKNICFYGMSPIFSNNDALEKRHPNDGTWKAFEQFLRNFVFPLALAKARRMSLRDYFNTSADGLDPVRVGEEMGAWAYHPRYLSLIAVPYWLTKVAIKKKWNERRVDKFAATPKEAQFILRILIQHLRNGLERVRP